MTDEVFHYGVKGMKWGVRKDDEKSGRESTRKERYNAIRNRELRNLTVEAKNGKSLELRENRVPAVAAFISSFGKNSVQNSADNASFELHSDGKRVGEASFAKVSDDEINLVWLGVRSSQRGQGYGSAAFDSAVAYGRSQGVSKLTLEVPGNAPDARHIYTKQGFSVTKEEPWDPVWGGLTHMELDLKAAGLSHSDLTADDEIELAIMQTFPQLSTEQEQELDNLKSDKEVAMSNIEKIKLGEDAVQELFHYGVKGMKWGVRKTEADGSPRQRGKIRRGMTKVGDSLDAGVKTINNKDNRLKSLLLPAERKQSVVNDVKAHMLSFALKTNRDPKFKGKDIKYDAPLREEYRKVVEAEAAAYYSKRLKEEYTLLALETGAQAARAAYDYKKKRAVIRNQGDDVSHADGDDVMMTLDFEYDDAGFIVDVEVTAGELMHYGVKGMKWGVRKDDRTSGSSGKDVVVTQKRAGTYAKAKGGQRQVLTDDAAKSLAARQKAKASTTDALTNQELRLAVERMNLEMQYRRLEFESDRRSKGQKFVAGLLGKKKYGSKDKMRYRDSYEDMGENFGKAMKAGRKVKKAVVS